MKFGVLIGERTKDKGSMPREEPGSNRPAPAPQSGLIAWLEIHCSLEFRHWRFGASRREHLLQLLHCVAATECTGGVALRRSAGRQPRVERSGTRGHRKPNSIRPGGATDYSHAHARTYHCLKFHLIFSTKNRERWLTDSVRGRIHDYLGGIIRGERGVPLGIGGVEDHVHILFSWRTDEAISDLVRNVKANSSKWIHETFSELRIFAWQEGYAIFSVSESQVEKVRAFIERQPEHHRKKSFKEEIGDFLRAHRVDHDPRYLWD
jgi:putative transposase